MAGIGWKLERMLERDSLSSTLQAYLTGVAVTSAPWLLTTALLVTLRMMAQGHDAVAFARIEQLITITYAVTLVLSAPIHVVVSRFAADRLYEKKLDHVAGPLRHSLVFTIIAFLVVGVVVTLILRLPLNLALLGTVLTAVIAAQWLLLAVGGGMSSPTDVLGAFALGATLSMVAALALDRVAGFGAHGYLVGFTLGQAAALAAMLIQIMRSLPEDECAVPAGALRHAFREYRLLALSAFAVYAAVWIDKIVTFALHGGAAATTLASAAAFAWFAVIPAFAWIYLQVETTFFRAFRAYFRGIENGASLDELEASAEMIRVVSGRLIRGAAALQVTMMVFGILAAPHIVRALGLPPGAALALRMCLVAASLELMTLLALLLLYYLDLRREAFTIAVTQLAAVGISTIAVLVLDGPPALGAAIGSALPAAYALAIVHRAVSHLVVDTFQSQPYGKA
jgi:uncharacterized membrane protein